MQIYAEINWVSLVYLSESQYFSKICLFKFSTCSEMTSAASVGSWHWLMTSQISWSLNRKLIPSVVKARKESLACLTCRDAKRPQNPPTQNQLEAKTSDEASRGLTESRCVSGSAMTPLDLRWKSPMLRVMASRPLTFACPTLFHDRKPPKLCILSTKTKQNQILFPTKPTTLHNF